MAEGFDLRFRGGGDRAGEELREREASSSSWPVNRRALGLIASEGETGEGFPAVVARSVAGSRGGTGFRGDRRILHEGD